MSVTYNKSLTPQTLKMKRKITLLFFVCSILIVDFVNGQCSGADFEEQNGIAVIEAEAVNSLSSGWRRESGASGFTGSGFLAWRGSDSFNTPGNGTIQFKVRINTPGRYRFVWRNRIGIIASSRPTTEHNDAWLKIPDASLFFAQQGSSIIYPGGSGRTPNPQGASSGGWFKVYTSTIDWNWTTNTSDRDPHQVFADFNSAGTYTIEISGRSNGHFIDRIVLYNVNQVSFSTATNTSLNPTDCDGSSPPPPPPPPPADNQDPTVNITSPTNGQTLSAGSNVTINISASDSDGSITKHQVFVNGSLEDTDGSTYTPYVISNISNGNYAVRVVVTDNSGATSEDSISFSVGGDNPPPPPPPPSGDNIAPSVSITSPSNGQNINTGSNISVNLSVSDSDGSIVKHQIFVNGTLVDTDGATFTPHPINNISTGNYVIKAVVTDNEGAIGEDTISFSVGGDNPPPPPPPPSGENIVPNVSITSPSNGQNISIGSNVAVNLSASDSDGSIVKHQIFVNGTLVDTDGANFTPHPINNIASGNYTIRAVVTDNEGATAEDTIQFSVGSGNPPPPSGDNIAPTVSIVNPSNGQNFNTGSTVSVNLSASDSDGSVVKYQIFVNGTLVDTDGANFTPHPIKSISAGNYTVKAIVTDNDGATAEDTIQFTVGVPSTQEAIQRSVAFPNPVPESELNVQLPEEIKGLVGYSIRSVSGMEIGNGVIQPENRSSTNGVTTIKIPQGSAPGVYYLILQTIDGQKVIPIVKE